MKFLRKADSLAADCPAGGDYCRLLPAANPVGRAPGLAWLSDGTGWKVSFNKMDHNFSSPLHLQPQNVTLGRDGKPATLVAQTVDIGFSSRQFADPHRMLTKSSSATAR